MSTYGGYGVSFFGKSLPKWVEVNKDWGHFWGDFHELLSFLVIALVVLHAFGAFYHHFVKKDDVLKRMAF